MIGPKAGIRAGNALMRARILHMEPQPLQERLPVYRVVEVQGKLSGRPRQVPLAVFQYAGHPYLIAPTRERDWVVNLIAAGACVLLTRDTREEYAAHEAKGAAAAAAALAYRRAIGNGIGSDQFPFAPEAAVAAVQEQLATMAIFRLRAGVEGRAAER